MSEHGARTSARTVRSRKGAESDAPASTTIDSPGNADEETAAAEPETPDRATRASKVIRSLKIDAGLMGITAALALVFGNLDLFGADLDGTFKLQWSVTFWGALTIIQIQLVAVRIVRALK